MKTDILVIGSGIAGLNAVLKASRFANVILATKSRLSDSNTRHAQGGLAACFGADDSPEVHVQDTVRAGDGLTNRKMAMILAEDSPKRVKELEKYGVNFNKEGSKFRLSREAVHSRARIVHSKDTTGKEIVESLIKLVKASEKIRIFENLFALDLISQKKRCFGCRFLDGKKVLDIFAKKTIIATGGIGQLYSVTTNPEIATADGQAIAFRAGALLEDMEFMQFHPTMLHDSSPSFLISETLRGEGALLKNRHFKSYMKRYHRDGDLAPRDVVSKFSVIEMQKTSSQSVFLDITHLDSSYLKKRFPTIYKECLKYSIDISENLIPVSPAAHYVCGGISTNSYGETRIKNFYAVGECACTQLHGADRLASNSMTESLVFGARLMDRIRKEIKKDKILEIETGELAVGKAKNGGLSRIRQQLQKTMWNNVGIIRTKKGLKNSLDKIRNLEIKLSAIAGNIVNREILELRNMLLVSKVITVSAIRRKESRGTHYIKDYPDRYDSIWMKHLAIDNTHRLL